MQSISEWLAEIGLEKYASVFETAEIDITTLPDLRESDLTDLGLPLGPRRKIWANIEPMRETPEQDAALQTQLGAAPGPFSLTSSPQPEKRHLTVMFVDLVGSTEMAVRMDAEDMREVFTQYQTCVTTRAKSYDGFVATLMGDGVLCYFGWPHANEDDTERAVRAGLAIIEAARRIKTPDGASLSVRVGVATGIVVVGDMVGDDARQQAAVVGETPNLAARLQSVAEPNQLIVPDDTLPLLGSVFEVTPLGAQTLKGVGRPVKAFAIRGEAPSESRFLARRPRDLTPIVGRDAELASMLEGWAEAEAGRGRVVVISGEAGIGKSRLAQAVSDQISAGQNNRIVLQCSPFHTESAFYPFLQPMRSWIGIAPHDTSEERIGKIKSFVGNNDYQTALVARLLGVEAPELLMDLDGSPNQQRSQLIQLLVTFITEQAREQSLLLIFEDLHWLDPTSAELLLAIIGELPEHKILLVATTRPEPEIDFSAVPKIKLLHLDRLGLSSTFTLVETLSAGKHLPDGIIRTIANRTDGVPLFVEELTKTILEAATLNVGDDRNLTSGSFRNDVIPATLHDSLLARLDRLEDAKEIAQIAACIGREFSFDLLARVCGLQHSELEAALDALKRTELIHQVSQPPSTSFQFKHALVRDAAYETLLKKRRRKIHKKVLNALETDASVAPEVLAAHAEAAHLTQRAILLWEAAAKSAIARPAYQECEVHLKRAISLNAPLAVHGNRDALAKAVDLHVQLFVAQSPGIGFWSDETVKTLEDALALADQLGETPLRGDIVYGLVLSTYFRGNLERSIVSADELNLLARASGDEAQLLVAERLAGVGRLMSGRFNDAKPYLDRAEALCDRVADQNLAARFGHDPLVGVYIYQSMLCTLKGRTKRAAGYRAQATARAQLVNHTNTTCTMHGLALFCAHIADDLSAERHHLTQMRLLVEEHSVTASHLWAEVAVALLKLGDGENAIEEYWRKEKAMLDANINLLVAGNRVLAARRIEALGDRAEALRMADAAEDLMMQSGERSWLPELSRLRANFALSDGDKTRAAAHLEAALSTARTSGARLWELRAALDVVKLDSAADQSEKARQLLAPLLADLDADDVPTERAAAQTLLDGQF